MCLIIFNQNKFLAKFLQQHFFSGDLKTGVRAEQPVTHEIDQ